MVKNILNKLSSFSKNNEYKQVSQNMLYLTLLNFITYLSPILLIPYLMKTVGEEKYGIYIFSWTFIFYFVFLVNYGFDFSATNQIAIQKNDRVKLSNIFFNIIFIRIVIAVLCMFGIYIAANTIHILFPYRQSLYFGFGIVFGIALFPTWLFQGMEEMKFITIVNLITRLLPLVFILILIKKAEQYQYIILIQAIGYLIGGVFSFFFAIIHYKLIFCKPSVNVVRQQLRDGWSLFLSTVGMTLYRETNVFIMGFTLGNYALIGYYSVADKFVRFAQSLALPVAQSLYPYFSRKFNADKGTSLLIMSKFGKLYLSLLAFIAVILLIIIKPTVNIYLGGNYPDVITNFYIMSPIIIVSGFSYYYGIVGLVNLGYRKKFTTFVFIVGALNIISSLLLTKSILLEKGASISIMLAETILFVLITSYYHRKTKHKQTAYD
ncbi:MAG: oligosaccharide flippase family protein [Paludibacteraceae bacterium]